MSALNALLWCSAIYILYVMAALARAKLSIRWLRKINESGSQLSTQVLEIDQIPPKVASHFSQMELEVLEYGFERICIYKSLNLEEAIGCQAFNMILKSKKGEATLGVSYYICKRILFSPYFALPFPSKTGLVNKNRAFETELADGTIINTHDLSDTMDHIGEPFVLLAVSPNLSMGEMLNAHLRLCESVSEQNKADALAIDTPEQYFEYHRRAQEAMDSASRQKIEDVIQQILEPLGDSAIRDYVDPH